MSWTKPGSVSSPLRIPPPIVALASYTTTDRPARARVIAAASPFGPDPTTIASGASARIPAPSDPAAEPVAAMNREIGSDHASPEPRNQ